jgi:hypothetical protein
MTLEIRRSIAPDRCEAGRYARSVIHAHSKKSPMHVYIMLVCMLLAIVCPSAHAGGRFTGRNTIASRSRVCNRLSSNSRRNIWTSIPQQPGLSLELT